MKLSVNFVFCGSRGFFLKTNATNQFSHLAMCLDLLVSEN